MSHDFLNGCHSKPCTIADLKVGDTFIPFPTDGDDHGHGGFRGGSRLFIKIEPYHPGDPYHESFIYTCKNYATGEVTALPLRYPIIKIFMS